MKEWHGCYQDSWQGVITPESFAHPAKFAKGLVERILDYMKEQEWIHKAGWVAITPEISDSIIADIVTGRYNVAREWIPDSSPEVNRTISESLELSLSGNTETTGPELGSKLQSRISGARAPSSCGKNTPSSRSRGASSSTILTRTQSTTESKISPASSAPDTLPATETRSRKRSAGKSSQREMCSAQNADGPTRENTSAKTASATTAAPSQGERRSVVTSEGYEVEIDFRLGVFIAPNNYVYRHASIIGDPFGGVGTGGIMATYRGYRWIGQELEKKFVDLAGANFLKHTGRWVTLGVPAADWPNMIHGDSRQFAATVHAILSSPPYVTDVGQAGGIVTSPPYAGSLDDGGPEKQHPDGYPRSNNWTGYGKTDGQIATLKAGEVEAVVTSPPFLGARSGDTTSGGGIMKDGYKGDSPPRPSHKKLGTRTHKIGRDSDREGDNIEVLSPGSVSAVISSPPYEQIHAGAGGLNHLPAGPGQQGGRKKGPSQSADQTYGDSPGQIARAAKGPLDAILTSPAYADSVNSDHCGIDFGKSKPDYPGRINHPGRNKAHADAAADMRYGDTPGQIGKLKAVVTSPPWEKNVEGGRRSGKFKGAAVLKSKRGKGATDAAVIAQSKRDEQKTLGDSPGQIGQEKGETYWQAMAKVYQSCLECLKPGGHMAIVVKDFVKDKKRMPLCDDTMRLLVWLGFEEVERIHAMLTETTKHQDFFDGEVSKKKERKSFFRRLHESKLPLNDPRRIDYEEILIVKKPA